MVISDITHPRAIFRDSAMLTSLGIKSYREVTPDSRYYWNGEFTLDESGAEVNDSSHSYIYMAFAETPFKYSNAR